MIIDYVLKIMTLNLLSISPNKSFKMHFCDFQLGFKVKQEIAKCMGPLDRSNILNYKRNMLTPQNVDRYCQYI